VSEVRRDGQCHEGAAEVSTAAPDQDDDLKLISLNSCRIDEPEEPHVLDYPHKIVVNLSPPDLMQVAFVMLHGGSEVLVVRGRTRESLDRFIEQNGLRRHPRLRWMKITGPNGGEEEIRR
jgi:hypothetical protein